MYYIEIDTDVIFKPIYTVWAAAIDRNCEFVDVSYFRDRNVAVLFSEERKIAKKAQR